MERERFDHIATTFAQIRNRREALRLFAAAALGAGALTMMGQDEGEARRRRGKKRKGGKGKNNERCLKAGDRCRKDSECCTDKTNRICEVAFNASNSDTTCCGGNGAVCGVPNDDGDYTAPFCCAGFDCIYSEGDAKGVCQRVPEDEL